MFRKKHLIRQVALGMIAAALVVGMSVPAPTAAAGAPSLKIISPADGATITTIDIPVRLEVSNFTLSPLDVGMPNKEGEGHIHVMHDRMDMATLFNLYTTTDFTLPGRGLEPGPHTLFFDLATNDHMDLKDTVQMVHINYQPAAPQPLPAAANVSILPEVTILSPADGATVGPKVKFQVKTPNFTPALDLEGKPDLVGYGHYHLFVDKSSDPMSMAGMVSMPGSDTFTADLSAWAPGKHVITIEPVNNDHTPGMAGAIGKAGVITIDLRTAPAALAQTGGNAGLPLWILLLGGLIVATVVFMVVRRG
jgi:hypothetical protein